MAEFCRRAWEIVEPGNEMQWNWHLELICDKLERIAHKDNLDTVFNVPPGTSKSLTANVFWPCWIWSWWPEARCVMTSYGQGLSVRDSLKRRTIIDSEWFRESFGVQIGRDQNEKMRFENTVGGWMFATSTGGQMTGEHCDILVLDDAMKADESFSEAARQGVLDWYQQTVSTRGVSRGVSRVAIAQRLHRDDLSGYLIGTGRWDHVCLPMRHEPGRADQHPSDPRTEEGELLWPALFDEKSVLDLEASLGISQTAGQLQQRPPDMLTGVEWPQSYFGDHVWAAEHRWPDRFDVGVIAVDPSKGRSARKGDYSGIIFVGLSGGKLWIDANLERRPIEKIVSDGLDMAQHYGHSLHGFGVEINGFQEMLATEFERQRELRHLPPLPMFPLNNTVNKKMRISRLGPYFANRKFVIRDNDGGRLLVKQCEAFSMRDENGVHDDGPDCLEMCVRVGLILSGDATGESA